MRVMNGTDVQKWLKGFLGGCAIIMGSLLGMVQAQSSDERYVAVFPMMGQIYHGAVNPLDFETRGLSLPRGTVLPKRMFPVKEMGFPGIITIQRPEYQGMLLRHPGMSASNYLDPSPDAYLGTLKVYLPVVSK